MTLDRVGGSAQRSRPSLGSGATWIADALADSNEVQGLPQLSHAGRIGIGMKNDEHVD